MTLEEGFLPEVFGDTQREDWSRRSLVTLKGGLQSEVFGDTRWRIGVGGHW